MPSYVCLMKFTSEGVQGIKRPPPAARGDAPGG